jgi:undecaprenyl diphosphate synthase
MKNNNPPIQMRPAHVAIIMDGNGRWANRRHLPRIAGHKQGIDSARKITRYAGEIGVQYLTLFGFSTENWKRPKSEVSGLMKFLRYYLRSELSDLNKNNVRLRVVGYRHRLDQDIVELIENAENLTAVNTGLNLSIALDYGGQQDILEATKKLIKSGISPDDLTEEDLQKHLMTNELPNPDLVIRTSGEHRISNFLLWQSAYAELYFTNVLWPDFNQEDFDAALECYAQRDRRMGALSVKSEQLKSV